MSVIPLPTRGNGGREALAEVLERLRVDGPIDGLTRADQILTLLWYDGFKIIPLKDEAEVEQLKFRLNYMEERHGKIDWDGSSVPNGMLQPGGDNAKV